MEQKDPDIELFFQRFYAYLKSQGLKLTDQRKALLEWIYQNNHKHFTAEDVALAFARQEKVSKATVYRTMSLLVGAGILEEQDFGEGYKTYELIWDRQHHDHIICIRCHRVVEFHSVEIEKLQKEIAKEHSFALKYHSLKLFGICPECQKID